jgi:hypothetical protein
MNKICDLINKITIYFLYIIGNKNKIIDLNINFVKNIIGRFYIINKLVNKVYLNFNQYFRIFYFFNNLIILSYNFI